MPAVIRQLSARNIFAPNYLRKGSPRFSPLSNMSFFPIAQVFRIHGVPGITVECPCTIQSRKTLPNGAPGMTIIPWTKCITCCSSSSHLSVILSVLSSCGIPRFTHGQKLTRDYRLVTVLEYLHPITRERHVPTNSGATDLTTT